MGFWACHHITRPLNSLPTVAGRSQARAVYGGVRAYKGVQRERNNSICRTWSIHYWRHWLADRRLQNKHTLGSCCTTHCTSCHTLPAHSLAGRKRPIQNAGLWVPYHTALCIFKWRHEYALFYQIGLLVLSGNFKSTVHTAVSEHRLFFFASRLKSTIQM